MNVLHKYMDAILDTEIDLLQHAADEERSLEGQIGLFVGQVTDDPNAHEHAAGRLAARRATVDTLIQSVGGSATLRQMELGTVLERSDWPDDVIRGVITGILLRVSSAFLENPANADAVSVMEDDPEYLTQCSEGCIDDLHQYIADQVGRILGVN